MRTIVWVGLGILALNVLLLCALACIHLTRRFRIARSRRRLEHLGLVVMLRPTIVTHPRWPRWVAGFAAAALLIVALSLLTTTPPSAQTEASAAGPSLDEGSADATDVTLGTNPGSAHRASPGASAPRDVATPEPSVTSPAPLAEDAVGEAGAPSTVAAVPTSATTIRLEWTPVEDAGRYDVERSIDSVAWTAVASTYGGLTSYTDVALSSGTTYYYRVIAFVDGQDATRSDAVSATTAVDTSTPPVFLSVTGSAASIQLAWSDVEGELGYRIERSPDGTTGWTGIGTTGQDVTSYTDTGLASATSYSYRVVAVTSDGESPPSTVLSATTDPDGPSLSQ